MPQHYEMWLNPRHLRRRAHSGLSNPSIEDRPHRMLARSSNTKPTIAVTIPIASIVINPLTPRTVLSLRMIVRSAWSDAPHHASAYAIN